MREDDHVTASRSQQLLYLCRYLEPDLRSLLAEELSTDPTSLKFAKLNDAIAGVVRTLSDL